MHGSVASVSSVDPRAPVRVVIVTLDNHLKGAVDRAEEALAAEGIELIRLSFQPHVIGVGYIIAHLLRPYELYAMVTCNVFVQYCKNRALRFFT